MRYERSLPLTGDGDAAPGLAYSIFTGNGLRVVAGGAGAVDVQGPGFRTNMIGSISRGQVTLGGGNAVALRAEFARLRRLPVALGVRWRC